MTTQHAERHAPDPPQLSDANDELRPIGAVAQELGLTPRTIRYYEELGLIQPAVRVKGASRLFNQSDIERLRRIKLLREVVGFSLAEIAELLDTETMRAQLRSAFLGASDRETRRAIIHEAEALANKRLQLIDRKLEQLQEMRAEELERLERLHQALQEETQGE